MKLNAFLEFPVHVFEPIFRPLRPVLLEKAYHHDLRDHYYVQQLSHFWHETTTQRNADAHCTGERECEVGTTRLCVARLLEVDR